ncbi:peptidylprolyl isomerase [Porphyromonas sp. COT-290 OH3588]|uniref:peptidylprolyl isomerase n=1 Tax=Porphyromonas sp. COT-290 OH3588 TaxID=1515617 RepID=UPI00052D6CFE|nr:peptidylprolyl isomerase [Porphyromonas sp. COT-290 OH3588]KGO01308.1 rotamase [Porphyromonas sp. COT-290 OH3588]
MAVLEKIRNNAGLLVGGIGVALAAFLLGDGMRSCTPWLQKSQQVALSIDGQEVSIMDYDARLQMMQEQMEARSQQRLSDEQRLMINNQLSQEYITDYAITKLAEELGLKVTNDELYALLSGQGVSTSPIARQFFSQFGINPEDKKSVDDLIMQMSDKNLGNLPAEHQARLRAQWQGVHRSIVNSRLQEKFSALLSRSYKITKLDEEIAQGSGSRTVALVRTTAGMISDSTQRATDAEIKKYYEEHKNFFRMPYPNAEVSYISMQVLPSADDYAAAEADMQKAYTELRESATLTQVEEAIRNYNEKFSSKVYLTAAELDQMGLGTDDATFIKTSEIGAVNQPRLVSDRYNLVKLIDKKTSAESIGVRILTLDSAGMAKSDSLLALLNSGADFAELAKKHSSDPRTAADGGLLMVPNQYGMTDSTFTEFTLAQFSLDTLYKAPFGSVITLERPGMNKMFVKAVHVKPAVEKYQVATVSIPALFSDKTYNERYAALNKILGEGGTFDQMAEKAEKEGFEISRAMAVSTQSPQLGAIPSSRPVITWAMNAKDGEIADKVYRCGSDYLVVAALDKHLPAGFAPLSLVREQIAARVEMEKRTEALAKSLESKALASLDAYATELNTQVDTLVGVSYVVRGSEGAAFNGKTMTTALNMVSKPFVAGSEVMVVQPLSQQPADATAAQAQSRQQEADLGRQFSYRAFSQLLQSLKVEDNRARFY